MDEGSGSPRSDLRSTDSLYLPRYRLDCDCICNSAAEFDALLSAPSSSFRPSDRKPLVRALTVLVLYCPSFIPPSNHDSTTAKCSTTIFHPFNNHVPTTSQPYFGSNTRTTRFRLNRPTSLKSVDSHLRLKVMIWYNMSRQWRKPKSPAGGEVSADGEEKSSPLTLKTMCGYE